MMEELPPSLSAHMRHVNVSMRRPPNKNLKPPPPKALRRCEVKGDGMRWGSIFIYSLKALGTLHLQVTELHGIYPSRSKHTASGNMCSGSWSTKRCPSLVVFNLKRRQQQKAKPHVSVAIRRRRLRLRRSRAGAEAMEMVNLKLYLENRCIIAENERLREKASALRRENLALRQNLSKTVAEAELPAAGAGAGAA